MISHHLHDSSISNIKENLKLKYSIDLDSLKNDVILYLKDYLKKPFNYFSKIL